MYANLFRSVALLGALSGGGAYFLFEHKPEFVDRVEGRLIREYVKPSQEQILEAQELFRAGEKEQAFELLVELADDFQPVKKLDRLFDSRRLVVRRLGNIGASVGQNETAVAWMDQFLQDDPKDLQMALLAAKTLQATGEQGHVEEAGKRLRGLFDQYSTVPFLAQRYIEWLRENGDTEMIADVLHRHISNSNGPQDCMQHLYFPWMIAFGATADSTSASRKQVWPMVHPGYLEVPMVLPKSMTHVSIQFSSGSVLELTNPTMYDTRGVEYVLGEPVAHEFLTLTADGLSMDVERTARVTYELPLPPGDKDRKITMVFDLTEYPAWLREEFAKPAGKILQTKLVGDSDGDWSRLILDSWRKGRVQRAMIARDEKGETLESGLGISSGAGIRYSLGVDGLAESGRVVFILPADIGDVLTDWVLTATGPNGEEVFRIGGTKDPQLANVGVDWVRGRGVVTMAKPRVAWFLDGERKGITRLELSGELQ